MKKYFIILVLLALVIFISGCIGLLTTPGDDSIVPRKGILKIYLTDASGDYKVNDSINYEAIFITISRIEVHIAGDEGGEWIVCQLINDINDNGETFDLIELKYEKIVELLSDEELTPGKYTQIRLIIPKASVLLTTEKREDVEVPSGDQTGIKLIHPFEIIENETTELTIDFDAEKSVVKTDNGEYILKPVIKVTSSTTINNTTPVNGDGG